ncbi:MULTISPECIES: hypothetical protein [unclassified Undibacterium]|uniref:hypothetical protein n=1 Tax=unclassified Undibacterium TaxID=2630295 RepID=UPI002AC8D1CC|nr:MULTISPECIES: hypothetical protein [unclassified Undibacterium]MEB0138312.1 hypothetical protein [Undibacterium sp. CCC2.1]MEB0174153.1 hypothetical protein [Undibacterium sp. CCC1.1]MEB0174687.1 hypothetical protein [Undibacterium sp. CCC3.4]MEB0213884.1 hypothetical protein [Undibacterium sp. 5I2]WPX42610.1 hypothetical protein RHM61_14595 [Undibacterium sp. CCC3.4]
MSNSIDLNSPPPNHNYSIKVDPKETNGERTVRLFKDVALFLVAICFVILLAFLCYSTLTSSTTTAEEKKWAMSILSGAAGGIIG